MKQIFLKIDFGKLDKHHIYAEKEGLGIELVITDSKQIYQKNKCEISNKIMNLSKKLDYTAHLPFYGLSLGSRDSNIRDLSTDILLKSVEFFSENGIRRGVMHPALKPMIPKNGLKFWYKNFCEKFNQLIELAEEKDFYLVIENTWEKDSWLFDKIFSDFNSSNLSMCLDIAHVYCFSDHDFHYWWDRFSDYISHIHLSDNDFTNDSHLQLGGGKIPYDKILAGIEKELTYTLETSPHKVEVSLNYLKKIGFFDD